MSKSAEYSLQLKLSKARGIKQHLLELPDYNPRFDSASLADYVQVVDAIERLNARIEVLTRQYHEAVVERLQLHRGKNDSVETFLSELLAGVQQHYGQRSTQFSTMKTQVSRIRAHSLLKPIQDFNLPDVYVQIQRFEAAYKRMLEYFQGVLELLQTISWSG